jgi:cytochrome P450
MRYDDCVEVLLHRGASVQRPAPRAPEDDETLREALGVVSSHLRHWLAALDPPGHDHIRRLVQRVFTPRVVADLRARIARTVEELLPGDGGSQEVELMSVLARPLPVRTVVELIGAPREDGPTIARWSADVADVLGSSAQSDDRAVYIRGAEAILAFDGYVGSLVADRIRRPRDDLVSRLVHADVAGAKLALEEITGTVVNLLVAGHETTTNLIGNGMLALLEHPEELSALRREPELLGGAIEELLRLDSPVQAVERYLTMPFVAANGTVIPAGSVVTVWLGAANRDPARFADPDRLDVRRDAANHVAFALGPHYCLGAALARLEGKIVFSHLLREFPNMVLASEPSRGANPILRGLTSLRLRLD